MGNELLNKEEIKDNPPDNFSNEFIRYGIISKKGEEKSNDDSYISLPNLSASEDSKKKDFSLFGIFDGHNSDDISKYLSNNIQKFYEKEIININKNNYKTKIEEIFKNIDKNIKERKKEAKVDDKKKESIENENGNTINEIKENNKEEEEEHYINIDVDKNEFNLIKEAIKNSKDIPEDLKEIDDSELENLLLFKNLFKYNNNYLYNNNNPNYIGSSASIVLINDENVIIANLGITKCILFNKEGNILNIKDNKNSGDYRIEHTFNNSDEKKRIKKFNKSIDYSALKINFYVPASRCFGFFKYKDNEILKEENQIISCVPDVYIYDKKDVDFILLLTKGAEPVGNSLNKISDIIQKLKNDDENKGKKEDNIKLSDFLYEYIKYRKEEGEKINIRSSNTPTGSISKPSNKYSSSIYVGKEDFGEENVIINELNSTYYKDIMDLNKNNDCHGNYNATCIFIQLLQKEKITPTPVDDKNQDNKKEIEINKTVKDENIKEENISKVEENKNEIEETIKIEEIKKENEENKEGVEETKKENEANINKVEENKIEIEENIKIEEIKKENEENIKNKNEEIKIENKENNNIQVEESKKENEEKINKVEEIKSEVKEEENKNESGENNKIEEKNMIDVKDDKNETEKIIKIEEEMNSENKEKKNEEDNAINNPEKNE